MKLARFASRIAHWCPGCKALHFFAVEVCNPNGSQWKWNGNSESPTFTPSMNIRAEFDPTDGGPDICHYFLTDGQLRYLGDSSHALKNRTVDLPDIPAGLIPESRAILNQTGA